MARLMKITGVETTVRKFNKLKKDVEKAEASVVTGYTQNYGIYVHENLEAKHAAGTQAKFLEDPAREKATQIGKAVVDTYKKTQDLDKSLLVGGLFLQRESQGIVPVDTGALRASAFTALESEANAAATEAHNKSKALRRK